MENNIGNNNIDNIGNSSTNDNSANNIADSNIPGAANNSPEQYIPGKKRDVVAIVVGVVATIAIIGLAGFYYYSMTSPVMVPAPVAENKTNVPAPQNPATTVINFSVPVNLPTETKKGYCWVNSVAEPYRADAWRCMVGNEIFDPCFGMSKNDSVFCQPDPTMQSSAFLITLTKPFPKASLPNEIKDNWAWYMQLQDGTYCSPYTGTRPFINGQIAYYNCQSKNNIPQPAITDKLVSFGYAVPSSPRTIDTIVIYSSYNATGDAYSVDGVIQEYKTAKVAPNYLIDRQGNIYRLVNDKNISILAGKSKMPDGRTNVNNFSISIELIYKQTEGPNDAQYLALNGLVQSLQQEYPIKYVLPHSQVSNTGKTDPWNFDQTKIIAPEEVVILGELKKGLVWTATKATLTESGTNWILKSSQEMNIKTIWQ